MVSWIVLQDNSKLKNVSAKYEFIKWGQGLVRCHISFYTFIIFSETESLHFHPTIHLKFYIFLIPTSSGPRLAYMRNKWKYCCRCLPCSDTSFFNNCRTANSRWSLSVVLGSADWPEAGETVNNIYIYSYGWPEAGETVNNIYIYSYGWPEVGETVNNIYIYSYGCHWSMKTN
jgi:hypothetical protein